MILSNFEKINTDFELLAPQTHENVTVIPIKSDENTKLDILTLKKGMELGLVEVKELQQSTVNTLTVKNNAVTPLILIGDEEVVGGDQNRIVNATTLIAPNTEAMISVSCTERGRWGYKSQFASSEHIANYRTRLSKRKAMHLRQPVQEKVWSSINDLEMDHSFRSATSAMSETYEHKRINLEEILESFSIEDGQNGILIMVDGEIAGFEVFLNSEIYKDFHKKVLKSYLIDAKIENTTFTVNVDKARSTIQNAIDSTFNIKETPTLEESYDFENDEGLGTLYIYEDEIIHWSYFKKEKEESASDEPVDDSLSTTESI